ncbi:MAG: sugar ABC transporter permease [Lachnospiraceae bacterium]|nr:sugar ABC transporter permease [Lachnospiraceae bacterium]
MRVTLPWSGEESERVKGALKKKPMSLRRKRAIVGYLFISPFILGFLLFILQPLATSLRMSFSNVSLGGEAGFSMDYTGIDNYTRAFTVDPDFNRLLVDSLKDVLINAPSIIIFSLIAAVLLNRKFPGRGFVRAIFFMPVVLTSGVVLGLESQNSLLAGMSQLQTAETNTSVTSFAQNVLLGSFTDVGSGIVGFVLNIIDHFYDIVVAAGIQTVVFLSALQSINPSIYESADIEGCTAWEKFWKITMPMVSPMILVNWIYTIVDRFIRSDNQLMVKILNAAGVTLEYGYSSAMAWVYCVAMLLIIGVSVWAISKVVYYYD